MPQHDAEQKLLEFLDRKAFAPVLRARLEDYPRAKRAMLERVQQATRAEQERYRHYGSAQKIAQMFRDDLSSEPAKKVHRELQALGLPTLNELREEFERLAEEVGATPAKA